MIQIIQATKKFKDTLAVNNVDLTINDGETFAILGPNGSGKSTLLKMIVGLVKPTSGKIMVEGIDVWKSPKEAKKNILFLPQRLSFPDNLTAREILAYYARIRQQPSELIKQILKDVHLNGASDKFVGVYSGGMIQRLGLGLLKLTPTKIYILDEPTVNLDLEGVARFKELIRELKEQKCTIVMATHLLSEAEQLADRIALLKDGRLIAVKEALELKRTSDADARMMIVFVEAKPSYSEILLKHGAREVEVVGDIYRVISEPDKRPELLEALRNAGAQIERFWTEDPTLEYVYNRILAENGIQ